MDKSVFVEESRKLSKVVSLVSSAKTSLEKAMESLGAFNLEKLKELRESPATNAADFLQFLEIIDTKNAAFNIGDKYKKLEELEYLSKEPYFSRIDLKNKESGKTDAYYIGKFGYTEKREPVVIDWRAKIASIYYKYRYPQKNVEYETPQGKKVKDLTLKRTFEIDSGELIKYYNNDIKLDETEIIAEKISKRTGGVLEDIIETIQQSEHEIIEADPRSVCIVQGTVGSGKSTVAIHKLSHIFFNYPNLIRPERSILIAKNQILVGYLSTLFPKLGIFNINYGTIRDVLYRILFFEQISTKFNLDRNSDVSSFELKDLLKLRKRLEQTHKRYQKLLEDLFAKPEYESFGGFVYDPYQPVRRNYTEAIQDLEEEKRFQQEYIKENPNHPRSKLFIENVKTMNRIIKRLSGIRSSIRTEALNALSKEYKIKAGEEFGYLEALLYLAIYVELIGFKKFRQFEYCVVDEGQDFGVLEYFVLKKLVQGGRFCILGDLNQSYGKEGLKDWKDIFELVEGAKKANMFILDTNYRSTKPIIEYAKTLLARYTKKYLPKPIQRMGSKPVIKQFVANNDVMDAFSEDVKNDIITLDKSIGIICFGKDYYEQAERVLAKFKLPKEKFIKLRESERVHYLPRAVYLTEFENCKGLEFGRVYILGLNPSKAKNFTEAKKAFVAVTRAMDELSIYYAKN